jgi:hypothetical protein
MFHNKRARGLAAIVKSRLSQEGLVFLASSWHRSQLEAVERQLVADLQKTKISKVKE